MKETDRRKENFHIHATTTLTNADVISIRARKCRAGMIRYRIVDEYEPGESEQFVPKPKRSKDPFSMGELIAFLDSVDWYEGQHSLTSAFRDLNYSGYGQAGLDELVSFVKVSSAFYPELERWYEGEAMEWYLKRLSEITSE